MNRTRGGSADNPPGATADWSREELAEALARGSEWVLEYRDRVESLPVFPRIEPGEVRARLPASPPESGAGFAEILEELDDVVVPGLTHWNHPGFMAYFPSSSAGPSIAAELLIAALGAQAMLWRTSPAATELELLSVDWLRQAVGLPDAFQGVILDTASTGSFTALLAAREAAGREVRERGLLGRPEHPRLALYVSALAHSSLEKAAIAAGLGRESVRHVPTDDRFRMDPVALSAALARDVDRGVRPAMICATVGTTSAASVDPVTPIADAAERHGAWLHVDAAYAGPAAMLPELREEFAGWERADSIVVNPHKWMGTPVDCSVLLFRDPAPFRRSLALTPAYLESEHDEVTNLMDFGVALGRRFRGLKLWMLFRAFGTDGLAAMLRKHIRWARDAAARLESDGRFELAAPVGFATVCFRAVPRGEPDPAGGDELSRRVLGAVNAEGRAFISHAVLDGRYTLRLSIGSVHTREVHVDAALDSLFRAWDREAGDSH